LELSGKQHHAKGASHIFDSENQNGSGRRFVPCAREKILKTMEMETGVMFEKKRKGFGRKRDGGGRKGGRLQSSKQKGKENAKTKSKMGQET